MRFERDVVVVGGCGHVGLPLGLAFAERGLKVALFDLNGDAVEQVENGVMPFAEEGADEVLQRVVGKRLIANSRSGCRGQRRERDHRHRHASRRASQSRSQCGVGGGSTDG